MLCAIAGDIIGSVYEKRNLKRKDFFPLFHPQARFTDDTVCTVAIADALLNDRHIPIWVMEPLRGGKLARLSEENAASLKALLKRAGERHMGEFARKPYFGRSWQTQQGIQLGKACIPAVFGLNKRIFCLPHVYLGLQDIKAGAQPHIVKCRGNAQLILQTGQGITLAAHAFFVAQIVQKLRLHIFSHCQLGIAHASLVAVGLKGGLLIRCQQLKALKHRLRNLHCPCVRAFLCWPRTAGCNRISLSFLLGHGIGSAKFWAKGPPRRLARLFRRLPLRLLRTKAGIVPQSPVHCIGHGYIACGHGIALSRRKSSAAKNRDGCAAGRARRRSWRSQGITCGNKASKRAHRKKNQAQFGNALHVFAAEQFRYPLKNILPSNSYTAACDIGNRYQQTIFYRNLRGLSFGKKLLPYNGCHKKMLRIYLLPGKSQPYATGLFRQYQEKSAYPSICAKTKKTNFFVFMHLLQNMPQQHAANSPFFGLNRSARGF